jgi:hypothetical protein
MPRNQRRRRAPVVGVPYGRHVGSAYAASWACYPSWSPFPPESSRERSVWRYRSYHTSVRAVEYPDAGHYTVGTATDSRLESATAQAGAQRTPRGCALPRTLARRAWTRATGWGRVGQPARPGKTSLAEFRFSKRTNRTTGTSLRVVERLRHRLGKRDQRAALHGIAWQAAPAYTKTGWSTANLPRHVRCARSIVKGEESQP